ncbi:MAG: prepilin-type N-terminal cleavage/methylation domain-containing protein, partial [Deferrisomatales bacterium]|nr:prepilin-type N-terminal cleavage/methylation domain-containing protein [Deferrisomatales bacterium]
MFRSARRGFTIVELLVALSVAAILLTLVYQVFIAQRRTYTAQEDVVEAQQSVRVGLETLTRDLQNIGAGVDQNDRQLLHCAPYEIVFYGNLDLDLDGVVTGPADAGSVAGIYSATTITMPAQSASPSAETYQIALRATGNPDVFDLVRQKLSGASRVTDELVPNLRINDGGGTVPLFRYWGDFDGDQNNNPDLWGDTNAPYDYLDAGEIAALTPVTAPAGMTLEDVVQRVEVQLVALAETRGETRLRVLRSNVVPRNLWPCPRFDGPPGPVAPLTIDDLFGGPPTTVPVTVYYQNQPYANQQVLFSLANTNSPTVETVSLATTPQTTDGSGVATTTINWNGDCAPFAAFFNGGGTTVTYELTATLPPFVSPFGTCPAVSESTPITVGPGVADRIVADITSGNRLSTCGTTKDQFAFTVTGFKDFSTCTIQVAPGAPVDFDALTDGGGTGDITDFGILDVTTKTKNFTVSRPPAPNFGTLATIGNYGYFPFYLTASPATMPVDYQNGQRAFNLLGTGLNAVDIVPWPPDELVWNPAATLGPFQDCDAIGY